MARNYTVFYRESRWSRAKSWSAKVGKPISGIAAGLLVLYITAIVTGIMPPPQVAHDLECRWQEWQAEPAPGTEFTILISNLADDPGSRQTNLVRNVFLGQRGIDVRRTCHVIAIDAADRSLADAETEAAREGQALLTDRNADLLISGYVLENNKALQLWFLSRERGASIPGQSYSITERYSLPASFTADFADQLEAIAFSQIEFSQENNLRIRLQKLRGLLSERTGDHLRSTRTALLYSFGRAAATYGNAERDPEWLLQGLLAYRKALQQWTRTRVPLGWAVVQQSLADALVQLGTLEDNQDRFLEAIKLYRDSVVEWDKFRVLPRSWATRKSIGDALYTLGFVQGNWARWEEAADTYLNLLHDSTSGDANFDLVTVNVSLGDVLASLGNAQADPIRLKEAVSAYRKALGLGATTLQPSERANTHRKIGDALGNSASMLESDSVLAEAVAAYETALRNIERDRYPIGWAEIQLSLSHTLLEFRDWPHGMIRFEEGIQTELNELSRWTNFESLSKEDFQPYGLSLLTTTLLIETENVALLEQAASSLKESVETKNPILFYRWLDHFMLGSAMTVLEGVRGDASLLQKGVEQLRIATELLPRERAPGRWATAKRAIGNALLSLADLQNDSEKATEAIVTYRQLLGVTSQDQAGEVGAALSVRGWIDRNPDSLREGIAILQSVEPERRQWFYSLGKAWMRLGLIEHDSATIRKGIEIMEQLLQNNPRIYKPISWAVIQMRLGQATISLAELNPREVALASLKQRIEALHGAAQIYQDNASDHYMLESKTLLARAEALLANSAARSPVE